MEALYDQEVAYAVTLRNLLQRRGYADLEAVRAEGEAKGRAKSEARRRLDGSIAFLLEQLTAKFGPVPAETVARIKTASLEEVQLWAVQLVNAATLEEALGAE